MSIIRLVKLKRGGRYFHVPGNSARFQFSGPVFGHGRRHAYARALSMNRAIHAYYHHER